MKIVILDGYTLNPGDLSWEAFEALGQVTLYDRTPSEAISDRIGDADAVITNKTPLSAQTLAQHPHLKYIGVLATGYNVVDIAAAKAQGIAVCNVPTYGTDSVAQFVFAQMLALCHRVEAHSDSVRQGEWQAQPDFCYWRHPLIELSGKTLGLVGYGRIAQRTAEIAKAFGMQVLAWHHKTPAGERDGIGFTTLDNVLAASDFVSLHVPLVMGPGGTYQLMDEVNLSKMKPTAFLINTARGPLVKESALADHLRAGKLAGAAVDVVSVEPIAGDNPLLSAPNCLITPHIAWAPKEARARLMATAADNLKAFLEGKTTHRVDL